MKKIIWGLVALFLILVISSDSSAHAAETKKRVAIIDTGIDITHPLLNNRIAYEVCILDFKLCPNGERTMDGLGAATLDPAKSAKNGFYHGTEMSGIVINNTDADIIFIRITPMTSAGYRGSVSFNVLGNALAWVNTNSEKYNIGAVSVSMGLVSNTCTRNKVIEDSIVSLKSKGIPAIFANGNNYNYTNINFPACFEPSIAVGGADYISKKYYPSLYSNNSKQTDFYALGKHITAQPNGNTGQVVGTSAATALVAAKWINLSNSGLTYDEVYATLLSNCIQTTSKHVKSALVINEKALK